MGAVEALTGYGLSNAAVIVQAAQMEGMDLSVAATLVAGESWGKHIWGHDPGATDGHYVKGGPVTQANYLAYRAAMRAGQIGRQGCGISQATSAEYQDRADELGGCWDMLANCRSGFRGMQALMSQHGVRDGARRYNGSGSDAEAYADRFMSRLSIWQGRLAAVSAARPAATEEDDLTPEQDKMLREIFAALPEQSRMNREVYMQMVQGDGQANNPPSWGWQGWHGGTGEHLTVVDRLRRLDVEVRQSRNQIAALEAEVKQLGAP